MKYDYFFRVVVSALNRRKGNVIVASASVALAAAIVTGTTVLTSGIEEKIGHELRAYGANLAIFPGADAGLDIEVAEKLRRMDNVSGVKGQVFGRVHAGGRAVELIGLDTAELDSENWRLQGRLPSGPGEILVGVMLDDVFPLERVITVKGDEAEAGLKVVGLVEKGGPEDKAMIMTLEDAWNFTGKRDRFSAVLARAEVGVLENVVSDIRRMLPDARVKTYRQVAGAEASLLKKVRLLMILVTVVVLFAGGICITGTMSANVLQRRREIGLMRAIGATQREVERFFNAESVLVGLVGGIAGFLLGVWMAMAVSESVFGSSIRVPFYAVVLSLGVGLGVAVCAGYFPIRAAMRYNPGEILKGE